MTSGLLPTNKNDLWNAIFTALVSGIKICPLGHSPESSSMATHIKCENPPPYSAKAIRMDKFEDRSKSRGN